MEHRESILRLYEEEHLSERNIARILRLSASTVHYWIVRGGERKRTKSGRPRCTTEAEDEAIVTSSTRDPFLTAVDIRGPYRCSVSTVRNRLKEGGLCSRTPARKPFLKVHHRQLRYAFARSHLNWQVSDWEKVCFSDEKIFRSSTRGALRVYRPARGSDRYDDAYVVPSTNVACVGQPRFTVCVWMAFCGRWRGGLQRVQQRTLNAQYYTETILASVEHKLCQPDVIFMQDLSSIHTSRMTKRWLSEHNIRVMDDWPPKGPDMNPVENVWAELVRRVEKQRTGVRNRDELWEDILNAFYAIPDSYFDALLASMPRRIRTVYEKSGGWTKY